MIRVQAMRPNVCGSSDKSLRDVETPIVLGNGQGRVRLKDGVPKCGVRASLPVRDYPSALLLPDSKYASVIVPEKVPKYHGGNYRRACRDLERDDTLLTVGIGIVPAAWRTSGESSNAACQEPINLLRGTSRRDFSFRRKLYHIESLLRRLFEL